LIAVGHVDLDPHVMAGIAARADPDGHRQSRGPGEQVRHLEEILGLQCLRALRADFLCLHDPTPNAAQRYLSRWARKAIRALGMAVFRVAAPALQIARRIGLQSLHWQKACQTRYTAASPSESEGNAPCITSASPPIAISICRACRRSCSSRTPRA